MSAIHHKAINPAEKASFVAAMDLGTNSNRLLIADANGKAVFRDVRHVALGDGLAENGCFSELSMERAICSFMDFATVMETYHVQKYRAIATAACRMSHNTPELIAEIAKMSHINLEVISEFEEARLTLLGARLNAPQDKKYLFVYDLGGGSTEITLATNEAHPSILHTISIPLGARNATEIFNLADYHPKEARELENTVKKYLTRFLEQIQSINYQNHTALIATSSTPLRLASWLAKHPVYDKFAADGLSVSTQDLDSLITTVLQMNWQQRADSPYVGPNRAGIFVAALVIFRTIYHALGAQTLVASLKGAQEAIIREIL